MSKRIYLIIGILYFLLYVILIIQYSLKIINIDMFTIEVSYLMFIGVVLYWLLNHHHQRLKGE